MAIIAILYPVLVIRRVVVDLDVGDGRLDLGEEAKKIRLQAPNGACLHVTHV